MKFFIVSFFAFWLVKLAGAAPEGLDLKTLGFVLWGKHGEGTKTTVASGCPLGTLPANVLLHKTFKKGDHFFTWVKPVHGAVNGVTCGTHDVWKGDDGELLLDLHFFGNKDSEKFLHLEVLTDLGGVAHAFLHFEKGATPGPGKVLGLGPFLEKVKVLMGEDFLGLEGLPAFGFLHELGFVCGHGLAGVPAAVATPAAAL